MSTLGLVLITGIGDIGGRSDFVGLLFGLGAAVFYATVILLNKFIKNVGSIHRTFLQFSSAIVILIPYVIMTSGVKLENPGWYRLGESADCRSCSYRCNILFVLFFFEGVARTEGSHSQLH